MFLKTRLIAIALACAGTLAAQLGHTTDWFTYAGDAQRQGWEKNEQRFTKDDVPDFKLLWQRKLDNSKSGVSALLPPVILGNLIGYRGFKELAFIAGSANELWSLDADLDRVYWVKQFTPPGKQKTCSGELTAVPALPPPVVFRLPVPGPGGSPAPARRRSIASGFAHPHPVFLLTGDGMLHRLNQSDGSDMAPPIQFVPPGVTAQPLNVFEDTVYTSTDAGCSQPAAVWAIDTGDPAAKVKSFKLSADPAGPSGLALSADGMAFIQTKDGVLSVLNQDLTLKQSFTGPNSSASDLTSPLLFTFKGEEIVAKASRDGRIYLLKAAEADHYLTKSIILPAMDDNKLHGIRGLASWEDTDGARYLLAPVWGPLSAELQSALPGSDSPDGSIVVFKVEDKSGPALTPAWISKDLESPAAPVIAQGVVFALANGKFSYNKSHGLMRPRKGTHATLFALDGTTGKQMYSTENQVTAAGNLTGLSVANSRVYFITVDNVVHVFGKYLEH